MQAAIIRQKFVKFFQENGHQVVSSSPLVPAQDPTLLFTNAGMVQFKDVFLGQEQRSYRRAVTVQKCMRAGGKHNDLDQVGLTARHQTFFEMLGNFSFGDYFKREAIGYAWRFLTEELAIPKEALWVTVFETDDEAFQLWQDVAGIDPARIVKMGEKDNFWSMGETGPCGPCSEIFVDRGEQYRCGDHCGLGLCECDRIQEVWNLVFMQYERDASGRLSPLPRPSIDTGMGLERIAAYLQGVDSNFDTDLLRPLITATENFSGRRYQQGLEGMPFRVVADHIRAITFLLAEGVSFSNEGRGYVMRRILRRAMRYGLKLGFEGAFLYRLVPIVGDIMGQTYPEVLTSSSLIEGLIHQEEERFLATLGQGMKVLEQTLATLKPGDMVSGKQAFTLYDTFGFPLDLTRDASLEAGFRVDEEAFDRLMQEQRERARQNRTHVAQNLPALGASNFLGYQTLTQEQEPLVAMFQGSDRVRRLPTGESAWIYCANTPFYPEGGGQVGDQGRIIGPTGRAQVTDTMRVGGAIWHWATVMQGYLVEQQPLTLAVDKDSREGAMRNHTATHLLHAALREVLGSGVHQTGSLVAPTRLRFDFSHAFPLTQEEIRRIENLVNRWVLEDRPVMISEMARDEALAQGALAFFGDKYGEVVRVVKVPGASQELCGGTHCQRTGQIGLFAIVDDVSVGGGSRRVEAVTGFNAVQSYRAQRQVVESLRPYMVGVDPENWAERIAQWQEQIKQYEVQAAERERIHRSHRGREMAEQAMRVGDIRAVVSEVEESSLEGLREVLDGMKAQVDVAVLASRHGDRVSLIVYFGDKVRRQGFTARQMVKPWSRSIEGGGGGREDVAQAGGKRPEGIPEVLKMAREWLHEQFAAAG